MDEIAVGPAPANLYQRAAGGNRPYAPNSELLCSFLVKRDAIISNAANNPTVHIKAYPGYGLRSATGQWKVYVSGVVWHGPVVFNRRQKMLIKMLGGVMQASPEELECETFVNRVTPFMAECDTKERVSIALGDTTFDLKRKTKRNGRFQEWLTVEHELIRSLQQQHGQGNPIPFAAQVMDADADGDDPISSCVIHLLPSNGVSIISDIDDTIKESDVTNKRALLNNTFLREFESVQGMSETYRHWAEEGTCFHYVSSSPWQLFTSLDELKSVHQFPVGTMHLRNFRLRDQLLKKVIIRRQGKRVAIQRLIKNLPLRRYILIGDSGEKDPEIYRKICRKNPNSIAAVFIRDLDDRPMESERWQKLKDQLPHGVCELFSNGEDLRKKAEPVFAALAANVASTSRVEI